VSMLLDADYAAIEARITPWVAGQDDALEDYRKVDAAQTKEEKWLLSPYVLMAAFTFQVPPKEVNKFPQRFVGKESILGCGFGLGADRFRVACKKKGYDLPEGLEFTAIKAWRKKHDKIVKFWGVIDDAAKSAVLHKGEVFKAGKFISFKVITTGGIEFLLMRLPSGRKLAYPWPRIVPGKFEGTTSVSFYQNLKGVLWGHNSGVWGGYWTENAVQGIAADIMCNGAQNAEDAGYEICALIHDQALAYHQPHQSPEEFVKLLTDLPSWAKGLPLAAEGSLTPFYRKD
jgi:DNA polymerase bacteriophage-type